MKSPILADIGIDSESCNALFSSGRRLHEIEIVQSLVRRPPPTLSTSLRLRPLAYTIGFEAIGIYYRPQAYFFGKKGFDLNH